MKLKDLRKVINKNQSISLVDSKGHFFCFGKNCEVKCDFDDLEVKNVDAGAASYGEYCIYITVD